MNLPPLSVFSPRLASPPEVHVRLSGHAAFDAAAAMQIFRLLAGTACEVTLAEAFQVVGAEPQHAREALRSARAVELLGNVPR